MIQPFELLLSNGKSVLWNGSDGPDAARRYVAAHPGAVVTAWRATDTHRVFAGLLPIVEPGDKEPR